MITIAAQKIKTAPDRKKRLFFALWLFMSIKNLSPISIQPPYSIR